jgi:hypothetical protein
VPAIEIRSVLPIEIVSEYASIIDHRYQIALLAIKSPYTELSATTVHPFSPQHYTRRIPAFMKRHEEAIMVLK